MCPQCHYYHLYVDQHPPNCGICSQTLPRLAKQRSAYSSLSCMDYNSVVGDVQFQVCATSNVLNDKITSVLKDKITEGSVFHETKYQVMQRLNRIFWHGLQDPSAPHLCLVGPDDQFLGVIFPKNIEFISAIKFHGGFSLEHDFHEQVSVINFIRKSALQMKFE
jgi:hypothetical protein